MEKGVVCSAVLSAGADGPRVVWNERKEATTLEPDATLDTGNLVKPYWDTSFDCNPRATWAAKNNELFQCLAQSQEAPSCGLPAGSAERRQKLPGAAKFPNLDGHFLAGGAALRECGRLL